MVRVLSVASALPEHVHEQREVRALLERVWSADPAASRLAGLFERCGVERRHFALPLAEYERARTFTEWNDLWIEHATELAARSLSLALERAKLAPRDVDLLYVASVTGIAAPSLDAKLVNRLGLRPDVRRVPVFGLGCVAGAALVARAADVLRAEPRGVAAVVCAELCSLTWQRGDTSVAHVISSGLFGDGVACALLGGSARAGAGPEVLATRSVFYPDTEDVMGWEIGAHGFRIVLSPEVPSLARERLGPDVDAFLGERGLARADIGFWALHPGGPKVLAAARDALALDDETLRVSWNALRDAGNLSSASVLLVLERTLASRPPKPGTLGLLLAMGPGFCSELVLLRS